jgi:beta-mannosidase
MFEMAKLNNFTPGEGVRQGAHQEVYDDGSWLDVPIPGDVHSALIAARRIEDPFYDQNESKCAWIEDNEWWYRLNIDGPDQPLQPGERLQLVFHGLDTYATVWLNGEKLGQHANMFREAVFDVTNRLRTSQRNTLAICFDRPLDHAKPVEGFEPWGFGRERVYMRKAQFGYGWDWGPRLPTVGIWRPVELRRQRHAAIAGVHFYTIEINQDEGYALVAVKAEVDAFAAGGPLQLRIRLTPPNSAQPLEQTVSVNGSAATAYLRVEKPALWWTHDLGTPALYGLAVGLEEEGKQLDERTQQVGIRTLELDQTPDPAEPGTRFFRFVLNGVPIFAKGADWIPAHSFVGTIQPARYEQLLRAARDANMNMLRVWGGGIYEHDAFYEVCSRLGLLVWQDFMFACEAYPDVDAAYNAEVEAEARYQVRRLRSSACMALWCGNNENQWIHDQIYWNRPDYPVPGSLYYDTILPTVVAELDGQIPYWPGSPYGGNDYNSMDDGDRHNWQVWHGGQPRRFGEEPRGDHTPEGVSFLHYAEDMGRFISEFGMHASPVLETLRRCIPADQLYHHSPSMDHHNKDNPKNKGDNLMETVTGLPTTLDEYVDFSMIAQAEGLKFGIEHFRRRKPHCSGTLFWQLNDCWPVLSWSVLDYYGFGKAGYFYARRVYAPVLASFKALPDGSVELWLTNDTLSELCDTATVRLGNFDGSEGWNEKVELHVPPNSSAPVARWDAARLGGSAERYLWVESASDQFPQNRYFFAAVKDLKRTPVQPTMRIEAVNEHELRVHLEALAYAFFVHLLVNVEGTQFSDNYFDIAPGQPRTVMISNAAAELSPEQVKLAWR